MSRGDYQAEVAEFWAEARAEALLARADEDRWVEADAEICEDCEEADCECEDWECPDCGRSSCWGRCPL